MMMLYRLVRMIETHSDTLAAGLVRKVRNSPQLTDYHHVPPEELKQRVYDIYHHLGEWLLGASKFDIEKRYVEIGARRARQHVPLSQLLWEIELTKENLWEFVRQEAVLDQPVELFAEFELLQLTDQFFAKAVYCAALGYERVRAETMRKASVAA
jgi:hypothetical protein